MYKKIIYLAMLMLQTCSTAAGQQEQPNILFIFSDDHAYQAVSAYQDRFAVVAPTPNIDRLANEGILFERSTVTNSICAPSRAVVLTGKHSHLNGIRTNEDTFDGNQQTFPKLLQANGYETSFIGKWDLKSTPTGFNHWQVLPGQGSYYNPDFITPKGRVQEKGYVSNIITNKALKWLEKGRDKTKPFLLMMQHKAAHRSWMPSHKYLNAFDNVEIPEPFNLFDDYRTRTSAAKEQDMSIAKTMLMGQDLKVWDGVPEWDSRFKRTYGRLDSVQKDLWDSAYETKNKEFREQNLKGEDLVRWKYQRYLRDYLSTVASIDESVGEVLDFLDKSGLANNTIVVYTSDQGFYLGEHGWFDKRFMYEESFRTPLLARWPGAIAPGTRTSELVSNLDLAPTVLTAAGVTVPEDMQGVSLVALMRGEQDKPLRNSLYYRYYEYPGPHNVQPHEGVATRRYKLINFAIRDEWELYDLENDPNEMSNQYKNPEYKGIVDSLKRELTRLKRQYKVTGGDKPYEGGRF